MPEEVSANRPVGTTRHDPLGVAQVWVPAGSFLMGSDPATDPDAQADEQPPHRVQITRGFWIDQYPVTNAAYYAFQADNGYIRPDVWSAEGWAWRQQQHIAGPLAYEGFTDSQQPRVGVRWYEAEAYATWRGGRLPTEAEWEYAARGPQARLYPWGNSFHLGYANLDERTLNGAFLAATSLVGCYPHDCSWCGAYDMAGNVLEWIADWYGAEYYQEAPACDPLGPSRGTFRVLRGGSWYTELLWARAAARPAFDDFDHFKDVGLRIVTPGEGSH